MGVEVWLMSALPYFGRVGQSNGGQMTAGFFHEGELVGVLTTQPIDRVLDYKAPEGGCFAGAFVEVPLGPRKVLGVVWGPGKGDWDYAKTRSVIRVLDVPPMREEMVSFLQKAGAYTLTPLSAMLRLATRSPGLGDPPSMRKIYRMGTGEVDRVTPARTKVLGVLEEFGGLAFTLKELAEMAGVGPSVVKGMVAQGAVFEEESPRDLPFARLDPELPSKELTADQAEAVEVLNEGEGYSTTLLKGVTGSGKTEVYLEAVADCLRRGRQALVLLPEIALTSEFLTRVEARFGAKPAEWHSGVTMTERRRVWKMVGEGGAELVVGARSALFLPYRDLGLIVVDEEHDTSYKQEDGVMYNARDMTVLRASMCGHQIGCDDCDARMVEHRFLKRLMCHQCGETKPMPTVCPHCEAEDRLSPIGPGVERMGEEVTELFPDARVSVLSSDHYSTARQLKAHIETIASGEADIIIGTQLVAKGHNFPLLTLVGVIDADLGLQGSDLRAAERTFQLMRQVAGRAGRAEKPGLALLQSFQPEHPVITAILSGDEEGFWRAEAAEREQAGVPPYGRMAGIVLSGPEVGPVFDLGNHLARNDAALRQVGAVVYGPAPAPIARIRGRHRVRLLVKAPKGVALQAALSRWVGGLKLKGDLRLQVDIDPQSFF